MDGGGVGVDGRVGGGSSQALVMAVIDPGFINI